jgi:signal transduction histidine kinase
MVNDIRIDEQGRVLMRYGPVLPLYALYWVSYVLGSAAILLQAYRATRDPAWRNRIRYPLVGTVLVLIGGVTNSLEALSRYPLDIAANLTNALLLAYAIARYQLMDIALVMRRALGWFVGALVVAAAYAASLVLIYLAFETSWIGFVVLGLTASIPLIALIPDLRNRAQSWVDRALFRDRYDLHRMLRDVSRAVTRLRPLPELAELLLVHVTSTCRLTHGVFLSTGEAGDHVGAMAHVGQLVEIPALRWRADHPLLTTLAKSDRPFTTADLQLLPQMKSLWAVERQELEALRGELFVPVLANGRLLAVLVLGGKRSGEPFSGDDITALNTLANQTAIAIDNARLYHEVQREATELEQANAELRQLDRLKNDFIQNVSHELRTPLTFVQGYAELLLDEVLGPLTAEQRVGLLTMVDRTGIVVNMVNDIISLTQDGRDSLLLHEVNLAPILQGGIDAARAVAAKVRVKLRLEIAEPVLTIIGDARRLSQVLDNLVGNAIKFSPNGGEIVVSAVRVDAEIHVSVTDQGIGMAPAELQRIWTRFYQVDGSSTRRFGGSGLGLTVVKRIVEAHGGRVWAESTLGQGSKFTCAFPVAGPGLDST